MWFKNGVWLLIIYFNLRGILGSSCEEEKTCRDCINHSQERCIWCPSKHLDKNETRCRSQRFTETNKIWCADEIYDPDSNIDYSKNNNASGLQFTPVHLKVKLRRHDPVHITFKYTPKQDQPLDVYLLIDNSSSMKQFIKELSNVTSQLQKSLTTTSNNVYMGVGSFIEKPAKPYTVSLIETYSFRNDLALTSNMSMVSETLVKLTPSPNSDTPEAGLDGLMQAMVCDEEIGWRPKSLRMIVYASGSVAHLPGDGKMLGIFKPNDMKCHLVNKTYAAALEYDYPSPGRLNKVATEKDISILFLIESNTPIVHAHYKQLAKLINKAQMKSMADYSKLERIIIDNYERVKASVIINYDRLPNVKLSLNPDCSLNNNKNCELSSHNGSITINATLSLTSCSKDRSKNGHKMVVGTAGLQSDKKLLIEIDTFCDCECESKGIASAPECDRNGIYQCGICQCNEDRLGDTCECDKTEVLSSQCDDKRCNFQGYCVCGQCDCFKGYSGKYCELSDTDCAMVDGKLCAGHGSCEKSKCRCNKGWDSREDCSCPTDTSTCYPKTTDSQECSNNGKCDCGECKCNKQYSGQYCEYCLECKQKTCKDLKDYAECIFLNNQTICDEEYNNLPKDIYSVLVEKTDFDPDKKGIRCPITFDNGSTVNFEYGFQPDKNKWILEVGKELEYPPKANIWVPIGAVIGSILLGGLIILLIWKCTIDYLDKKEFDKFEAEAKTAGFNVSLQNPVYKDPVVVFRNPKFNQKND